MDIYDELITFWISNYPINYNSTIVVNGKSILLSHKKILLDGILKKNHSTFYLNYAEPRENQQQYTNFENIINLFENQNGKIKDPILLSGNIGHINQLNDTPVSLIAFNHEKISNIFHISMIFEGVHFKNFDDIKFKEITLSFSNIESFIKTKKIDEKVQEIYEGVPLFDYLKDKTINSKKQLDKKNISYKFKLDYKLPSFEEIELDRFKLKIKPNFRTKNKKNQRKVCLFEEFKIWLKYHKEEDFIKIQEDIVLLKKFFTLILEESNLIEVKGKLKSENRHINIYTPKILETLNNKDNKSIEPLFQFEEITNPRLLFKNWFEKYEILETFYDLYFTPIFSRIYAETEFLLYTQTLETYYRKMGDSVYFDENSYVNLKQLINSSIKDIYANFDDFEIVKGFKDKLKSSIKFAYQKSLRTMLKELLDDLDYFKVNEILNNNSKKTERKHRINDFVNIVVNIRNYYTHYDDEKPNIYELIDLLKELKCIVEICFMKELGLTKNEIDKITENNRFNLNYSYYNNYCKF